jgi:hypothetical protein
MTQQHPITPPPELVEEWHSNSPLDRGLTVATRAAQWGADQELEACRHWLEVNGAPRKFIDGLLAARRPKPSSLKEQALEELAWVDKNLKGANFFGRCDAVHTIRRALEQLDD